MSVLPFDLFIPVLILLKRRLSNSADGQKGGWDLPELCNLQDPFFRLEDSLCSCL